MAFHVGERVEGLSFVRPGGDVLAVADFAGRPLLLIFLRHLA